MRKLNCVQNMSQCSGGNIGLQFQVPLENPEEESKRSSVPVGTLGRCRGTEMFRLEHLRLMFRSEHFALMFRLEH